MFACQYCKCSKKIEKRFGDFLIEIQVLNFQNNIVLGTINLFNTFFIQQKRKKNHVTIRLQLILQMHIQITENFLLFFWCSSCIGIHIMCISNDRGKKR